MQKCWFNSTTNLMNHQLCCNKSSLCEKTCLFCCAPSSPFPLSVHIKVINKGRYIIMSARWGSSVPREGDAANLFLTNMGLCTTEWHHHLQSDGGRHTHPLTWRTGNVASPVKMHARTSHTYTFRPELNSLRKTIPAFPATPYASLVGFSYQCETKAVIKHFRNIIFLQYPKNVDFSVESPFLM